MVIYKTTNLVNGKYYIGKDVYGNPAYLGSGRALKKAIEKYGKENFIKEILCQCSSKEELNEKEKSYVTREIVSDKMSYNLIEGGQGGDTYEYRKNKGSVGTNVERYGEERAKVIAEKRSKSLRGERNGMYGKKLTEEHKQKMIEGNRNRDYFFSDAHKERLKKALTGRKDSEETRLKKKEAAKNKKKWPGKRNCTVFDEKGNLIGVYSVTELCRLYETKRGCIYKNKITGLNIIINGSI
jgi:group I intron endonuclease